MCNSDFDLKSKFFKLKTKFFYLKLTVVGELSIYLFIYLFVYLFYLNLYLRGCSSDIALLIFLRPSEVWEYMLHHWSVGASSE